MEITRIAISELKPYERHAHNSANAVRAVAESIRRFGFKQPLVVDKRNVVVCGHARLAAAKSLGMTELPCVLATELSEDEIRAFRILDNKLHEKSSWDVDALVAELAEIKFDFAPFEVEFDLGLDAPNFDSERAEPELERSYQIVVTCADEEEQSALYERLVEEGYQAKLCNL